MAFGKAMLKLRSNDLPDLNGDRRAQVAVHILLAAPRGYCAGVTRAIAVVRDALAKHGAPVYVRRPIVHNMEVVRTLEGEGAVFVRELDEVPRGAVVVFSAHGVSPDIAVNAEGRGLTVYDAVCPLVSKVHREVERHQRAGRAVILIGHDGHPEIEGTIGRLKSGPSFIVASRSDVAALPLARDAPAAYAVQTTYSVEEAADIVHAMREKFVNLAGPSSTDICYATTNRQAAVRAIAARADAVIIVGEQFSSNARRLAEVAASHCDHVQLVAAPSELDWNLIQSGGVLGVSAAASTPESSVDAIVDALAQSFAITIEEVRTSTEDAVFKPLEIK